MPQTTKEQVMEKWKDIRKTVITLPQKIEGDLVVDYSAMVKRDEDFISSTYDTAYEKGVRDAMEILSKTELQVKDREISEDVQDFYKHAVEETKRVVRLALSELLKK